MNYKVIHTLLASSLLVASQVSLAHTRLKTPTIDENGAAHGSNYNDVVIAHGCDGNDTIANIVVFPDGVDSTVTVNGEASDKSVIDYVANWGNPVTIVKSRDVFDNQEYIKDPNGNKVGFYSYNGTLTSGFRGVLPFTTSGVVIQEDSCAKSVQFKVAIFDICELTDVAGFRDETVQMWIPAVGSIFEDDQTLHGYDSPATLTINRSLSELPEACGEGETVVVSPSAEQLNRDATIEINGTQVWPAP